MSSGPFCSHVLFHNTAVNCSNNRTGNSCLCFFFVFMKLVSQHLSINV